MAGPVVAQTMPGVVGKVAARLRLVAAPDLHDGAYRAGVEISLPEGAHTYWKNPGEAGVPPVFSFNGSGNVADATVSFPVPTRIVEEGLSAFGYTGTVVFPVAVRPQASGRPVMLHADVNFAVCSKICLPQQASADLLLPAGAGDAAAALAADARVPKPASAGEVAALKVTPLPGLSKPSWLLEWTGSPAVHDVFPIAPDGYVFTTAARGSNAWTLTAVSTVAGPHTGTVPVALTLAREGAPIVVDEALDVSGAAK